MPFIPSPSPNSGWVVVAPVIVVADAAGGQRYLYTGAPVPASVPTSTLNQLAAAGLIVRG